MEKVVIKGDFSHIVDARLRRIRELESLNAELVEALEYCENVLSGYPLKSSEAKAWQVAYDILAKARGES